MQGKEKTPVGEETKPLQTKESGTHSYTCCQQTFVRE